MVWRTSHDRKLDWTKTVGHCGVDVRAVMSSEVVPNENPMRIRAGDIVQFNIRADMVAEVTEYVGGGANGT